MESKSATNFNRSAVEILGVNKNHHLGGFFRCLKVKISFPSKDNLHCKYVNADCLAQAVRLIINYVKFRRL